MDGFSPSKTVLFEGSFFWGGGVNLPLTSFVFHGELIYQHNFMQLLNNLFKVC